MDIIHLLPDSVANQIAAGEVVQRPASVIKELMENAIDAGASNVDVLVVDAGRTTIQVIDDGKGMSPTDARLAFERHATSKIQKAEDLFSLHTMGFRGEALPSIAAVAQVHLTTRTLAEEVGTEIFIEGSQVTGEQPCSCPVGANFQVSNLFYNVPARRKFLKSNHTELNNIIQDFERVALVNPSVSFTLSNNGNLITRLPASTLRQRIVTLFGKKLGEQLLQIEVDTSLVRLTGFVGKPDAARKKNASQYFFVNGRYMRHPYFNKAVQEAYNHLIPEGEQIPYFLYFEVDPANIDVNIHPTKTEIKFENESDIWPIIVASIRTTLGRFNAVPTIEFDTQGCPDIPAFDSQQFQHVQPPRVQVNTHYNPFHDDTPRTASNQEHWQNLYAGLTSVTTYDPGTIPEEPVQETPQLFNPGQDAGPSEISHRHFQFHGQYILTPVTDGLLFVDQHRAHMRILYDRYIHQMQEQKASSQGLLFPDMLQLPPSDAHLLEEMADELQAIGFDITHLGAGSYSISGVPADLQGASPVQVLREMVETAKEKEKEQGMADELQHRIALVMARNAAIPVGQALTTEEMDTLLTDLFQSRNANYTPTGQPVTAVIKEADIAKMFK